MTRTVLRLPILAASPGTERRLVAHRYGRSCARPKAYLQASLHADETPPMLVLHHLLRLLDAAAAVGEVAGQVVVVPAANPIGLDQELGGVHIGRHAIAGGGNFNRNWPDLFEGVAARLSDALDGDRAANVARTRAAFAAEIADWRPADALDSLRHALMSLAADADIVLDLHCDHEALVHLYLHTASWPDGADLAAEIGSRGTFLAEASGGNPFDEAFSTVWHRLGGRFGQAMPVPMACLSATVELRGRADVSDALAADDARALFRFLQRRGVLAGDPGPLPAAKCAAVPLAAVDVVRSPFAGVLAYACALGQTVAAGEILAEVVDPMAEDPAAARTPIAARFGGLVLSRRQDRLVRPGQTVAKVVGREPLPTRGGHLLED